MSKSSKKIAYSWAPCLWDTNVQKFVWNHFNLIQMFLKPLTTSNLPAILRICYILFMNILSEPRLENACQCNVTRMSKTPPSFFMSLNKRLMVWTVNNTKVPFHVLTNLDDDRSSYPIWVIHYQWSQNLLGYSCHGFHSQQTLIMTVKKATAHDTLSQQFCLRNQATPMHSWIIVTWE